MKHPLSYVAKGAAVAVLLSFAPAAFKYQTDDLRYYIPVILSLLATQVIQLHQYARKLNNANNHFN